MADTAQRVGGGAITPSNVVAGMTYSPLIVGTDHHPDSLPPGTPVYPVTPGGVTAARANVLGTSNVSGLLAAPGAVGQHAPVLPTGSVLHLEASQWDVVTGGSGGLEANQRYFLSAGFNEGRITTTAPTTPGQVVAPLGLALSSTDMALQICCPEEVPG